MKPDRIRNWILGHKAWVAFAVLMILLILSSLEAIEGDKAHENLHAHQAMAFLQGRLELPETDLHDVAIYKGKHYSVFPPFPAVVLTPFVAAFGMRDVRLILVSLAATALSVFLLRRILLRLGVSRPTAWWAIVALFCGTGYWFCVLWSGGVWYFAHVIAVACLLMAIDEATGAGRGWLAGLALGLAFLSRQMTIYAGFFLAAALWTNPANATLPRRLRRFVGLGLGAGFCILIYMAYNYLRFDHPFDTGYAHIDLEGFLRVRVQRYGVFNWRYIPFNLMHMFLEGVHIRWLGSDALLMGGMSRYGTSLTFASPFVFFAVLARRDRLFLAGAWLSIGLTLLGTLLYYNNGFVQPNAQRFALDFLPILILLVGLSADRLDAERTRWLKAAIVYSVALNAVALIVVPFIHHTLKGASIGWDG